VSNKTSEGNYNFPLYLYAPAEGARRPKADFFSESDRFGDKERIENIAPTFRTWLDEKYQHHYSPEELFGYVYAILYAPAYRARFAEFLRIDFPRVPFPEKRADFAALSKLGWELTEKHLLREVPTLKLGAYHGKGGNDVDKPRYVPAEEAVHINATQYFSRVPAEVWEFQIGGYQVIDKYLKSRKGRVLSLDEINNVESMVNVLAFTIDQVAKIDGAYQAAFPS
jgi:predicted helicase